MTPPTTFDDERRGVFLDTLAETGNVSEAAQSAGVSRSYVYDLRRGDAQFRMEWDQALETAVDALEQEVRRRALCGWDEPVFYGGEQVGARKRYSDALLKYLLTRHRPSEYGAATERAETGEGQPPRVVIEMHFGPDGEAT